MEVYLYNPEMEVLEAKMEGHKAKRGILETEKVLFSISLRTHTYVRIPKYKHAST